jgi:phosphoribosylformimino-5-aminoimidazole carboxamide ribotide isomerase
VELTAELARAVPIPVIASGGLASAADIVALRGAGAGIAGAILGRALYDGRVEPAAALAAARG